MLILISIYEAVVNECSKSLVGKYTVLIAHAKSSEESMELRRKYKEKKKLTLAASFIGFVIFLLGYYYFKNRDIMSNGTVQIIFGVYAIYLVIRTIIDYNEEERNFVDSVSILTKEELLKKHDRFILYLRAFERDQYVKPQLLGDEVVLFNRDRTESELIDIEFTERKLVKALEDEADLQVCAVGMTKEADQPVESSLRVYVNDDTWQEDVRDIMEAATAIYVLVSSRESCLWEIKQLKPHFSKTVLVIDDIEEYNRARDILGNEELLPEIPDGVLSDGHGYLYWLDGKPVFGRFDFSQKGYKRLVTPVLCQSLSKPLVLNGMFKTLDESFDLAWTGNLDSAMRRLCDRVTQDCPVKVNGGFTLDSCELDGSILRVYYTVDSETMNLINEKRFVYQRMASDLLLDEIGDTLKNVLQSTVNRLIVNTTNNDSGDSYAFEIDVNECFG